MKGEQKMNNFIVTFTPFFKKAVLKELQKVDSDTAVETMFDEGKALITTKTKHGVFIKKLVLSRPIFIKHIMPVQKTGHVTGDLNKDKTFLLESSLDIARLSGSDTFAIQCRIAAGGIEYSSKDIEVYLGEHYAGLGNTPSFSDLNLRNDEIKVISVFINKDTYYMGFSTSEENLNFHSDEYRIMSRGGRKISRAENKLKEALSKFKISLDGHGIALDLGAAPGGWTKVLADYGYNVVAVDPGELHPNLKDHPKITHHRTRIEKLNFNDHFDIIVNDMNVDPQITAKIMCDLANALKDKGLAIVTLKLPFGNVGRSISESSEILSKCFEILDIKSLFHNRQEVTALLKKKNSNS